MKVTRIIYVKKLNKGKYTQLLEQAKLLGKVRSEVWQRFGSVKNLFGNYKRIKSRWVKEKRNFATLANPWKETLRDAINNIKANREAAKKKSRKAIFRNTNYNDKEKKELYKLLKFSQ